MTGLVARSLRPDDPEFLCGEASVKEKTLQQELDEEGFKKLDLLIFQIPPWI